MERRKFLSTAAATGAGATAAVLGAPAIAQGKKEMAIVSTWQRDFPGVGTSAQRLAARITELTQGRITTRYFAAGERVGAFDAFDEVASGNAQAYIGPEYYWKAKHPAFSYFTTVPMGMTANEVNAWIKYGGGQKLWDTLSAEFGIKSLPAGNTGTQMGGWFNKEITSVEDLKGLKIRMPGLGAEVMSTLGASPVSLPGGEIYEKLVSGGLDATEWIGPWNDYYMKFYETARFYYYPGLHEPGAMLCLGMNLQFWNGLSPHEQQLLTAACLEENANNYDETNRRNGEYLARLVNDHGVQLRRFPDEIFAAFGEATLAVMEQTREHGALARQINDDYVRTLKEVAAYSSIAELAYSNHRNRLLGI